MSLALTSTTYSRSLNLHSTTTFNFSQIFRTTTFKVIAEVLTLITLLSTITLFSFLAPAIN